MPPEFRPEFLSLEFRTKEILPGNDLILTCVPTESGNAVEFRGFRKMRPGRNRNTKRNAHPRVGRDRDNDHRGDTGRRDFGGVGVGVGPRLKALLMTPNPIGT